jgi:diamine N-acetyltransferase
MLFGKSVRLRAIDRDDIPTFVRWFNDPEVRHYLQAFEPMSRAGEERWFEEHLKKQGEFLFSIEAPVDGGWLNIGNVGLHRVDWKNRGVTFGIVLGERAYWGKGFGTDATRTMLKFAFGELNLHRVELEVYSFNPRAMRCYEKAGFRLEGTRRQAHFHQGAYHDVHCMGILRDESHPD